MSVTEDATLTLTMQAIDDASDTLNALRSTIQSTADANASAGTTGKTAGENAASGTNVWSRALQTLGPIADFVKGTMAKLGETAGLVGVALDLEYRKALDSAVSYADATERISFITGMTTEQADGLISAFRAQGMTTDEAAGTLQRLEMRLGSFGTGAGKAAAEAEKLQKEIDKGGKAGEAAKVKLEALDNQTGGMVSNMRELGLSYADVTGHGRSMDTLLPSIIDHLKGMTDPMERARLASQLFGRNYSEIAPIIEAGGAAFSQAEGDAAKYGNALSQGQVDALHAFRAAQEQAKEAIDGFTGDMALMALPVLKGLETMVRNLAGSYDQLSPRVKTIIQDALAIVAIAGPLLGAAVAFEKVGVAMKELAGVSTIFKILGFESLGGIATAIAPLLPILAAVALAILALKLAYDNIKPVHEFIDTQVRRLTQAFGAAMTVFRATSDPITALYVGLLKLGVPFETVNQWTLYLRQAWDYLTASVKPLVVIVQQSLQSAFVQLQPVMRELQMAFVQLRPVMDVLGPVFAAMGAVVLILLGGVFKALIAFFMTALPTAIQLAVDIIHVIVDAFKLISDVVTGVAKVIMDIVHGDFHQALMDLGEMFMKVGVDVIVIVGDLVRGIVNLVVGLAVTVGATLWGFVKGIIDTFTWLWDKLTGHSIIPDMINDIVSWFKSLPTTILGIIEGLAWDMVGAAEKIGISMIRGIVNGIYNLDNALSHALGSAIHNVPGVGDQVDHALGLPTYDVGGWVNAPLGAPQLAVVHGGEFVQNRAMIASGVSATSGGRASGGGDVVVNVILDGKVIQRQVMKGGANDFRLRGGLLGSNA